MTWEDTFDGPGIDSKWTLYPMAPSGTGSISNGKLDLFADGPTDETYVNMVAFQTGVGVTYPITFEIDVECPGFEGDSNGGSLFSFLILHNGNLVTGPKNGAGLYWSSDGHIVSSIYDSGGVPGGVINGINTTDSIRLRISVDASGQVSLAYKSPDDADWNDGGIPSGTPSFSGQSQIDIAFIAGSSQLDKAHHWLVDYLSESAQEEEEPQVHTPEHRFFGCFPQWSKFLIVWTD